MTDNNTTVSPSFSEAGAEEYLKYRELSISAVAALVVGIISFVALPFAWLAVIPFIGVILARRAIKEIKSRPEELAGLGMARAGLFLSAILFVASIAYKIVDYSTELPVNASGVPYTRVAWNDLQPDKARPELPVSPQSLDLHDKEVFIKGYVYPDDTNSALKTFVLVPDRGTCCFGGQPKLTDMIEVKLKDPLRVKYSFRQRKLGGILKVDTRKKPVSGLDGVYYQLEADHVK